MHLRHVQSAFIMCWPALVLKATGASVLQQASSFQPQVAIVRRVVPSCRIGRGITVTERNNSPTEDSYSGARTIPVLATDAREHDVSTARWKGWLGNTQHAAKGPVALQNSSTALY
jgi:hypothetical protein